MALCNSVAYSRTEPELLGGGSPDKVVLHLHSRDEQELWEALRGERRCQAEGSVSKETQRVPGGYSRKLGEKEGLRGVSLIKRWVRGPGMSKEPALHVWGWEFEQMPSMVTVTPLLGIPGTTTVCGLQHRCMWAPQLKCVVPSEHYNKKYTSTAASSVVFGKK